MRPLLLLLSAPAVMQGLPAQHEALAMAFPGCTFVRKDHYPSPPQMLALEALAGAKLPGLWYVAYEAVQDGKLQGVAFFDTHRVRTETETAMIAVGQDGRLRRVEVIAFREPPDYAPRMAWLAQFQGRALDADLSLKRGIRPLAGATLTGNALLDASRRGLALWKLFYGGR